VIRGDNNVLLDRPSPEPNAPKRLDPDLSAVRKFEHLSISQSGGLRPITSIGNRES